MVGRGAGFMFVRGAGRRGERSSRTSGDDSLDDEAVCAFPFRDTDTAAGGDEAVKGGADLRLTPASPGAFTKREARRVRRGDSEYGADEVRSGGGSREGEGEGGGVR